MDATDCVLGEVSQRLVEPGRLEVADGGILVTISGVDHVLKFVGYGATSALTNRARTPDVAEFRTGWIWRKQVENLGLVALGAERARAAALVGRREKIARKKESANESP